MSRPLALLMLLAALCPNVCSTEHELTLMTGREASIDYKMGKDLQTLLQTQQIDLNVIPSIGSMENIVKVYEFPSIQLGIVQFDTLTFHTLDSLMGQLGITAEIKNILSNMQLVLPLYSETLHVLVPVEITKLRDLNGKRIAIGRRSSNTHTTALNVLRMFQIKPEKTLAVDLPRALELLQKDRLDALFHLSPIPDKRLQHPLLSQKNYHLLPIDLRQTLERTQLKSLYQHTQITSKTYAWQTQTIASIEVRKLLLTTDTGKSDCLAVGKLADLLYNHLQHLQQHGHPQWSDVQIKPKQLLKHSALSPCVRTALEPYLP